MKTRNLAEFGQEGLEQVKKITELIIRNDYPYDFYKDDVVFEFDEINQVVYLTNDYNQICKINDDVLDVVYELPYCSETGFIDELVRKVDDNIITNIDDINFIKEVCESRYDFESVTICIRKLKYEDVRWEINHSLILGYDDIDEIMVKNGFTLVDESDGGYHDMVYQYDYDDDIEFMISVNDNYDVVSIIDQIV